MSLLLTMAEVEPLLDLRQAMQVLEGAYRHQAEGKLDESPPLRLMGRKIRLVAGGLPLDDRVGVRLSVGAGGAHALALVYANSGELLSIMGYPFSELRLAATMALAIERLARPDARKVWLIGSGQVQPRGMAVFRESQGGYSDVALASFVYQAAVEGGLGREFSFG